MRTVADSNRIIENTLEIKIKDNFFYKVCMHLKQHRRKDTSTLKSS